MKRNDYFKGLFEEGKRLRGQRKRFVVKEMDADNLFEVSEETFLEESGPITESTTTVHRADCGHIVGFSSQRELSGRCAICGRYACFRCLHTCDRCRRILCGQHVRRVGEKTFLCLRCRLIELGKKTLLFITLGIHVFLSKEVIDEQQNRTAGRRPDQISQDSQAGGRSASTGLDPVGGGDRRR